MFVEHIVKLINQCLVPAYIKGETSVCDESDYDDFRSGQLYRLENLLVAIKEINLQTPTKDLKNVLIPLMSLFGENNKIYPWNSEEICNMSNKIKSNLLETNLQSSESVILERGLKVKDGFEMRPLLKDVLLALRPKLLKETWKKYPCAVECFCWLLEIVKPSSLSGLTPNVLPMALLLVDDYINENKVIGVKCLTRILDNMTIAELKYHGYGQLIYKALERLLRERDVSIATVAVPCTLSLMVKLEADFGDTPAPYEWSQLDDAMEILLEIIQVEQHLNLRKLYIGFMPQIIDTLNHKVYRWAKRISSILDYYLEMAGKYKDVDVALMVLKAFKFLILKTEKIIPEYREDVSFVLLRAIYHIHNEDDSLKKKKIIKRIKCLLKLIHSDASYEYKLKFKTDVSHEISTKLPESSLYCAIEDILSSI